MNWWQVLLFPFAIIYDIITRCRNWLFDIQIFKSHVFKDVFTISVGNLTVGGAGKTPMVEYLIRMGFKEQWQMAVLSRGYGRASKGVLVAKDHSNANDLGDESYGYYMQFGKSIEVVVAESRVSGMQEIRSLFPAVNVVILDDAFQHRQLKPDLSFLLTTFKNPFWNDYLLPSGHLREARVGCKRSDQIVITKCPKEFSNEFIEGAKQNIPDIPLACSTIEYGQLELVSGILKDKVVAVSAIANNDDFVEHVRTNFQIIDTFGFADHHAFSKSDVQKLVEASNKYDATIVCTYKDYVKLKTFGELSQISWAYLPIRVKFLIGESDLKETLKTRIALHSNTNMES